MVEEIVSA